MLTVRLMMSRRRAPGKIADLSLMHVYYSVRTNARAIYTERLERDAKKRLVYAHQSDAAHYDLAPRLETRSRTMERSHGKVSA
jgi:hypothetical protein